MYVTAFTRAFHLHININIIFPYKSRSCKWSLSVGFLHQNPICTSLLHLGELMVQTNNWFQATAVCVIRSRHILAANISVVLDLSPILILLGVPLILSAHAVSAVKEPPRYQFGTKYSSRYVKLPTRSIHLVCFCFVLNTSAVWSASEVMSLWWISLPSSLHQIAPNSVKHAVWTCFHTLMFASPRPSIVSTWPDFNYASYWKQNGREGIRQSVQPFLCGLDGPGSETLYA